MKKIFILLLLLPLFCKGQQLIPIDTVDYAQKAKVVSKVQADSLAGLMVRLGNSYTNPSWLVSIPWSKVSSAPTNVSFFTNDAGYLTASNPPNSLTKSSSYTIVSGDFASGKPPILHIWVDCTSGALTATLPTASSFSGYVVVVGKTDASGNLLTISGCSFDNKMSIQNSVKEFFSNGTTWLQN